MGDSQPKRGGKNLSTSDTKKKYYADYKISHTREKHKIKRVLNSSGYAAAELYAKSRALTGYLLSLKKDETK